ncbi:unnamed protein product, partial [Adineta steineri]
MVSLSHYLAILIPLGVGNELQSNSSSDTLHPGL